LEEEMTIETQEPKFKIGQIVYYGSEKSDNIYELTVDSIEIDVNRVIAEQIKDKVLIKYHCSNGTYSNIIYEHEISETLEEAMHKKVKVYRLTD
jgi:hypothetical protein